MGTGSGFLFTDDGYTMTNNHVVQDADRVTVMLHDRRQFDARVVARGPSTDVAVVKIDATGLPAAALGNSDSLRLGQWVLAPGSPLGLKFTVTAGIVSATGRSIGILAEGAQQQPPQPGAQPTAAPLEDYIQTDAVINPGNSGGPLVNLSGNVVGMNSAIASPTGAFAGYGFAAPIDIAWHVARARRPRRTWRPALARGGRSRGGTHHHQLRPARLTRRAAPASLTRPVGNRANATA